MELKPCYETKLGKLYCGDAVNLLKIVPDNSIDLTVTSPPYDNLRTYNGYSFDFETVAKEIFRVTKAGGVVIWVVGDQTLDGDESGTSFRQALFFKEVGFRLFDTMIYQKRNCPMRGSLLGYNQVFEYMFVLSKGRPKTTNLLRDRKNAEKRYQKVITHRKRTGEIEAQGTYVSKDIGLRYNIWVYANGKGVTSEEDIAFEHPAIFPEQLAKDHIISWSNVDDLILDPFMGSGTTAKLCEKLNRKWIGFEISKEYCELAKKRISKYQTTESTPILNSEIL